MRVDLYRLKEEVEHAKNYNELGDAAKSILEQLLEQNAQNSSAFDLAKDMMKFLPWIGSALGIASTIINYLKDRSFEKGIKELRKSEPLIIIDNSEYIGSNFRVLSDLSKLEPKCLYILGPTTAEQYWQFVTDYGNVQNYLQEKQLGGIKHVKVLPLPSIEIFSSIMKSLGTEINNVDLLFENTGGVISVAEMLKEVEELRGGDFKSYLYLISYYLLSATFAPAQITNPPENESNRVGKSAERIATALQTTMKIYDKLIKENDVYRALCCKREGISPEVLKRFCYCNRNRDSKINNNDVLTELELFRKKGMLRRRL